MDCSRSGAGLVSRPAIRFDKLSAVSQSRASWSTSDAPGETILELWFFPSLRSFRSYDLVPGLICHNVKRRF